MSRMRLILLSLITACAIGAVASASASASPMYWIKEGAEVKKGERLVAESHGGPYILKGKIAGVNIEIACEKESGKGWIENPVGEVNAIGFDEEDFTKCTVPKPAAGGCKVHEPIALDVDIDPVLKEGKIYGELTPDVGVNLGEIMLEGCVNGALNGASPLSGVLRGLSINGIEEGTFEFTATSGSEARLGGNPATFIGKTFLKF
jgi:hypothetical protein